MTQSLPSGLVFFGTFNSLSLNKVDAIIFSAREAPSIAPDWRHGSTSERDHDEFSVVVTSLVKDDSSKVFSSPR